MAEITAPISDSPLRERRERGLAAEVAVRLVKEKKLGLLGGVIVLLLLLTGIFADFI